MMATIMDRSETKILLTAEELHFLSQATNLPPLAGSEKFVYAGSNASI